MLPLYRVARILCTTQRRVRRRSSRTCCSVHRADRASWIQRWRSGPSITRSEMVSLSRCRVLYTVNRRRLHVSRHRFVLIRSQLVFYVVTFFLFFMKMILFLIDTTTLKLKLPNDRVNERLTTGQRTDVPRFCRVGSMTQIFLRRKNLSNVAEDLAEIYGGSFRRDLLIYSAGTLDERSATIPRQFSAFHPIFHGE